MIDLILSERDFDYELQALLHSFFPGQRSRVIIQEVGEPYAVQDLCENASGEEPFSLSLGIFLGRERIAVSFFCQETDFWQYRETAASGEDWHRHEDKSAHPARTRYKNELKRLVFFLLKELPSEALPDVAVKEVPVWGTMTGVRPTKIPMNELLQGKTAGEVEASLEHWYCCSEEKKQLCMEIALRETGLLRQMELAGSYSLYIGIPFCPTTCLYCSFPSYPVETFGQLTGEYLQALKKELWAAAGQFAGRKLTSIYMGGGTPTALCARELEELLACIRECFPVGNCYEFTVEAGRPDSITEDKLAVLRNYGVGRISVNPQTMQQKTLDLIGRRHTVEDTKRAFRMAREAGFANINMDLIIGLPQETEADFADTLRQIKELNPDSITVHSLVVKRASGLRSVLEEGGDFLEEEQFRGEQMEKMLVLAREFAREEGYLPYYMYRQKNSAGHFGSSGQENIGYARAGKECIYNILIMEEMQTILALGAGASTKVYHPDKRIVSRVENVKSITDYISRVDEMIGRKQGIDRNGD